MCSFAYKTETKKRWQPCFGAENNKNFKNFIKYC